MLKSISKIFIASDHAGFELKSKISQYLEAQKINFEDLGTNDEKSVDYPEFGKLAALAVSNTKSSIGIVVCGSGIGISIAANKIKGIRCALVYKPELAILAKEHNNANMLALAGRFTSWNDAKKIIENFLNTPFDIEHPRHNRRVMELNNL